MDWPNLHPWQREQLAKRGVYPPGQKPTAPTPEARFPLSITIPGPPVSKGRPRGNQHRTPAKTREWERGARKVVAERWPWPPWKDLVAVEVLAYHPRPQKRPPWMDKAVWDTGLATWAKTRQDADNVLKSMDCLQPHMLKNDNQACRVSCESKYAAKGEEPCVVIVVRRIQ